MSYDNILFFGIFYLLYVIAFIFAVNFVKAEWKKGEDEEKKYSYLKDSELHDGKTNVYKRIIEDKYFDYARYIKVQDRMMRDMGFNDETKRPLGTEEFEGLQLFCLEKNSSGLCCCGGRPDPQEDLEDYQ